MLIDIFHDFACPWCWIGKKHLFDAIAQWHGEAVRIRWHPFLLDNSIPPEGYEFRSFMQARKGIEAVALQQMFDRTRQVGERAGVKLDFNQISLAVNTTLAHQLVALTPEDLKTTLVEAIYQAYFERNLNLGDRDTLISIGDAVGVNTNKLRNFLGSHALVNSVIAESTFARLNGITSVPLFIFNNKVRVDGSHSVEVFKQAMTRAALMEKSNLSEVVRAHSCAPVRESGVGSR
ncbi:DsbA family oxidoreductase [Chroococcidiopsis thermalis]|uniref:DSBA oxidoreductase n=1 Tax=Chroococcidiopsis thermalis (strain PCC 7203) TaxID=251229 RepID=K9U1U0_CHRTP|nr:DsbA family oxidoreductase [Chroococcidiopsis thermalis]AFY88593.1 DSBA oxidoreductase [Chroococcidiopsis thermalis PCC 7203]PSB44601.1 DsbA family oxidoreductase [Cyanosarcina cf. burmensis CCALA 770]